MMASSGLSIAICGGGACGLGVLLCLLQEMKESASISHIYICERSSVVGPGLAYSSGCGESIINMAAETMSLYPDDPSHFSRWVITNHPGLKGVRYPPRHVYGQYLSSLFESAKQEAAMQGLHLEFRQGELINLCKDDGRFVLIDDSGRKLAVDRVVLALGNFTTCTQPHLAGHPRYLDRPWPLEYLDSISPTSSICVVGARLSGIDAALHLAEGDHSGPIYLVSRSGCLPSVQRLEKRENKHARYMLELLARDIEALPNTTSLPLLVQRFMILAKQAGVNDCEEFFQRRDPLLKLSQDVLDAETGVVQWRLLVDSAAPILERFWNRLTTEDQALFMESWQSKWYMYVHAMPYENALRVQKLLKDGILRVLQYEKIYYENSGFVVQSCNERIHADYVIEATGLEYNASHIRSRLLQNLIESKFVEKHPVAGLLLCQNTLESVTSPGIYVIGSLTTGVHFYTNGIDRNAAHASRISRHLVGKPVYAPAHVAIVLPDSMTQCANLIPKIATAMLKRNILPFVYLRARKDCTDPVSRLPAECLAQSTICNSDSNPKNHTIQCNSSPLFYELCQKLGILTREYLELDTSFLKIIEKHHIDIGLLLQSDPTLGMLCSRFQAHKISSISPFHLLSPRRNEGLHEINSDLSQRIRYHEEKVIDVVSSLLEN